MALSFVINKIVRQRVLMRLLQGEMDDERRLERRLRALYEFEDEDEESAVDGENRPVRKRMIRYIKPPVSGPLPVLYFTRLERHSLRVTWAKLTDRAQSRWKWTRKMLEDVFRKMSTEKLYKQVYYSLLTQALTGGQPTRTRLDSCTNHAQSLFAILNEFVDNVAKSPLDDGYAVPNITHIASIHLHLDVHGFRSSAFDRFGELIIDAFLMDEMVQSCPNGRKAWMMFFVYFMDTLRGEYERLLENKRKELKLGQCFQMAKAKSPKKVRKSRRRLRAPPLTA